MPNRLELLQDIKASAGLLDDSSFDTYLKLWINRAQAEFDARYLWDFQRTVITRSTVAGSETIGLGGEFLVYNARNITQNVSMKYITDMDLDRYDAQQTFTGSPMFYTQAGQSKASADVHAHTTIQVYPTPNAVETLKIRAYSRLIELTQDTDVSAIPETYHDFLVHWVCFRYFSAKNDTRAQSHYDLKENVLKMAVEQIGATPADKLNVLRSTDEEEYMGTGLRLPANYPA